MHCLTGESSCATVLLQASLPAGHPMNTLRFLNRKPAPAACVSAASRRLAGRTVAWLPACSARMHRQGMLAPVCPLSLQAHSELKPIQEAAGSHAAAPWPCNSCRCRGLGAVAFAAPHAAVGPVAARRRPQVSVLCLCTATAPAFTM